MIAREGVSVETLKLIIDHQKVLRLNKEPGPSDVGQFAALDGHSLSRQSDPSAWNFLKRSQLASAFSGSPYFDVNIQDLSLFRSREILEAVFRGKLELIHILYSEALQLG